MFRRVRSQASKEDPKETERLNPDPQDESFVLSYASNVDDVCRWFWDKKYQCIPLSAWRGGPVLVVWSDEWIEPQPKLIVAGMTVWYDWTERTVRWKSRG